MPKHHAVPVSEMEMRVLAVLKVNDGHIDDAHGHAVARLWKLSTIESRGQAEGACKRLVGKGIILKDIRYNDKLANTPHYAISSKCMSIVLVDDDYPVAQWAMEELWAQIRERQETPGVRTVIFKHNHTHEPEPEKSPEERVADAILAKVFHHAKNPVYVDRVVHDPQLQANIDKLQAAVDKLAQENEGLKKQLSEEKGKRKHNPREHLTQTIGDLAPEEFAKMMTQKPHTGKERG